MPIKLSKQWFTQTFMPISLAFIITLSIALSAIIGVSSLFVTANASSPVIEGSSATRNFANNYTITFKVKDTTITTAKGISATLNTSGLSNITAVAGAFDSTTSTYPITFPNVTVYSIFQSGTKISALFAHNAPQPNPVTKSSEIAIPDISYEPVNSGGGTPPTGGGSSNSENVLSYSVGTATSISYNSLKFAPRITIKLDTPIPDTNKAGIFLKNDSFSSSKKGTIAQVDGTPNIYVVTFPEVQYHGKGRTLQFSVLYNDYATPVKDFSVVINECVEGEPTSSSWPSSSSSSSSSSTVIEPAKPYILINNYTYGGKQVAAGKDFTLNTSFYNTSTGINLENIILEITPSADILLKNSTNKHFITSLAASETMKKDFTFSVKPTADVTTQNIAIKFTFDYFVKGERKSGESSEIIPIPISQTDSFKAFVSEPPEDLMEDGEEILTMTYVNSGRSTLYNVTTEIQGDIQKPSQLKYIGNIESGKTANHDFDIMPKTSGELPLEIIYNYEDVNGVKKQLIVPYTISVTPAPEFPIIDPTMGGIDIDGMVGPDGLPINSNTQPTANTTGILIFVAVVVGVIIAIIIVLKIVKKRKEMIVDDNI